MKKIIKMFICMLCMFIIMFTISGCKNFKKSEKSLEQKIDTEISYLDDQIVGLVNKLNNIYYEKYKVDVQEIADNSKSEQTSKSQQGSSENSDSKQGSNGQSSGGGSQNENQDNGNSKQNDDNKKQSSTKKTFAMKSNNILNQEVEINWDQLTSQIEDLYVSWTTIANDFKALGISNEEINEFSQKIDNVAISIKNKDKNGTIQNLIDMYSNLSEFSDKNNISNKKQLIQVKYNLLMCYKNADSEDWEEFKKSSSNLKISFSNIMNKKDEFEGKEININNAEILISELNNSEMVKDKQIFFIKYKNLMQELNNIE